MEEDQSRGEECDRYTINTVMANKLRLNTPYIKICLIFFYTFKHFSLTDNSTPNSE